MLLKPVALIYSHKCCRPYLGVQNGPVALKFTGLWLQRMLQQPPTLIASVSTAPDCLKAEAPTYHAVPPTLVEQLVQSAPRVKRTFYKRTLPCPPAIAFSSTEGRQVFQDALQRGTMTGFFKLIEQYNTQYEPAYCGLASLAMVLNALAIDPRRTWKGSWRWFHEELLDCCKPLDAVRTDGIVLSQAACLARCNGAKVELHEYGTFTLDAFRQAVRDVCSSGEEHLVISYSRKPLLQTGDGHYSPVGGYHEPSDSLLILDVARFKYPPHWVPVPLAFEAMGHIDPTTGSPRGFMRLAAHPLLDSVAFTLDIRGAWEAAHAYVSREAPSIVQGLCSSSPDYGVDDVISAVLRGAPLSSISSFVALRASGAVSSPMLKAERCVPTRAREAMLEELRMLPLFLQVSQHITGAGFSSTSTPMLAEQLTLLLMLPVQAAWLHGQVPAPAWMSAWLALTDAGPMSVVGAEVQYLREQLAHIEEVAGSGQHEIVCGGIHGRCATRLDCVTLGHDQQGSAFPRPTSGPV